MVTLYPTNEKKNTNLDSFVIITVIEPIKANIKINVHRLPLSQCILSIGYPATGHFTIRSRPEMPVILDISRMKGSPYMFTLALCDTLHIKIYIKI